MKLVDLRSDTVTKPSKEMWDNLKSLDDSKIGDDVYGEDPTINALEEKAAHLIGKEAALYVTSGTQGNLISLMAHTNPHDSVLVEELSHIYRNEINSATKIAQLEVKTYASNKGAPDLDKLFNLINKIQDSESKLRVLCVENTHNYHGGAIIRPHILNTLHKLVEEKELKFHLDGARIFNAAVATNTNVIEFSKYADSIMFCLSKGLSCPVGSLVAGSSQFISKARKYRQMVGGGMRQAGIIASFGLLALDDNWIQRLKEDHKNAKSLAKGLEAMELPIQLNVPETNMVIMTLPEAIRIGKVIRRLGKEGILALPIDSTRIRFVTHFGINRDDIKYALKKMEIVLPSVF
ncbi:MAG: L-allo-threonine aldolase [Promethearchaeota archaeon]|nr:MAG: L-allo-threonine aldolase [Candidatus Lokiarchaeota archaeon]